MRLRVGNAHVRKVCSKNVIIVVVYIEFCYMPRLACETHDMSYDAIRCA